MIQKDTIELPHALVAYANYYQFEPSMVINNVDVYSRMLLWCESGMGEVTANGDTYIFTKGRYLILPWRHSIIYKADDSTPFTLGGVHLIPYYDPQLPFKVRVAHNKKHIWWEGDSLRDEYIPHISHVISGRYNNKTKGLEYLANHSIEVSLRDGYSRTSAHSLATLLIKEMQYVIKNTFIGSKDARSSQFDHIAQYIEDNIDKELSLDTLCTIGGVSVSTLRRLFLHSVGLPPYEWILRLRLEKARRLLRTTPDPISRIAFNTGFEDPSYFTRLFHKREGMTPYHYRAKAPTI